MKTSALRPLARRRGVTITFYLIVLVVVSLVVQTLPFLLRQETRLSVISVEEAEARALAESGVEWAIWWLRRVPAYKRELRPVELGRGKFALEVAFVPGDPNARLIRSLGFVQTAGGEIRRSVEALAARRPHPAFERAVSSGGTELPKYSVEEWRRAAQALGRAPGGALQNPLLKGYYSHNLEVSGVSATAEGIIFVEGEFQAIGGVSFSASPEGALLVAERVRLSARSGSSPGPLGFAAFGEDGKEGAAMEISLGPWEAVCFAPRGTIEVQGSPRIRGSLAAPRVVFRGFPDLSWDDRLPRRFPPLSERWRVENWKEVAWDPPPEILEEE